MSYWLVVAVAAAGTVMAGAAVLVITVTARGGSTRVHPPDCDCRGCLAGRKAEAYRQHQEQERRGYRLGPP